MSSGTRVVNCGECGKDLTEEIKIDPNVKCPDCGSRQRNAFVTFNESIVVSADTSVKVRDPSGFVRQEERSKSEIYEKTGEFVTNSYSVDRTDPDVTRTHHKVVGFDEHHIIPKTIHEHVDESPAKRRPKNND